MTAIQGPIQIHRGTAANWTANNPTLLAGELGYETDTGRAKVGDGSTAWTSLAYRFESGGGGGSGPLDAEQFDRTSTTPGSISVDLSSVTKAGAVIFVDGASDVTVTALPDSSAFPVFFVYVARITGTGVCTLTFDGGAPVYDGDQYTATSEANGQAAIGLVPLGSGDNWLVDSVFPAAGGSGDVVGPASATDSHVALFDGTSGKLLKDGGATGAAGLAILTKATASDVRTYLGLVLGTDVQAYHANLTAFAGLSLVADRLPYANGAGTLALATFTSSGRTLVSQASLAAVLAQLSGQATADFDLNSHKLTGVSTPTTGTDAANKNYADSLPRGTGYHYRSDRVGSAFALVRHRTYVVPMRVPVGVTIIGIVFNVTTGVASNVTRIGLYLPDGTDGRPSTRVVDAGTVTSDTSGQQREATISYVTTTPVIWIAANSTAGASDPNVTGTDPGADPLMPDPSLNATNVGAFYDTAGSGSGALPSSFTWSSSLLARGSAPRLGIRI